MIEVSDGNSALNSIVEFTRAHLGSIPISEQKAWANGFTLGLQAAAVAPRWAQSMGHYLQEAVDFKESITEAGILEIVHECPIKGVNA